METANRPTTAWAPVRLLPELATPNAWASLASTTIRPRVCAGSRSIAPISGTDVDGAYAAAAMAVVALGMDADHKISTRLGPSASPPV